MSDNDSTGSSLNHEAGSFTHNNADQLPSQTTAPDREAQGPDNAPEVRGGFQQTRDEATQKQEADLSKTEAQRREEITRPVMTRSAHKLGRSRHQPTETLAMETDLPEKATVDRTTHDNLQRKEDIAAMKEQPHHVTQEERQESGRHLEPSSKEQFVAKRFEQAHGPKPSQDKSR